MVVRLLGDRIYKLGTVRDYTSIVGQTLSTRIVGDGVMRILCGLLARHQGHQEHRQIQHHSANIDQF